MTKALWLLGQHELAGAVRARWFVAYTAVFLTAGVVLAAFGLTGSGIYGYRGFAKSFAGLVHVALLFVPIMALVPATAAIADERESGALDYVLAQPLTFGEVYLGKWLGVTAAVALSLTAALGTAGAVALLRGVPASLLAPLYGLVVLLATAFIALGIAFSTIAASRARAFTLGIVVWLGCVALGTLGIMAAFVRWGLPEQALVAWAFVNPVEAFRIGVVITLDPDLSVLGPVGVSIVERFGRLGTMLLAVGSLGLWTAVPGLAGWWRFRTAG